MNIVDLSINAQILFVLLLIAFLLFYIAFGRSKKSSR